VDESEEVRRPAPVLTSDSEFFWRAAVEQRLAGQACTNCTRLRHPPRPMCPHCGSLQWTQVELSGRGTLYSFSILHYPQNPQFDYPVIAALVDLDEGIRMVSNIVDASPEELHIGQRVMVRFEPTIRDMAVPVFSLTAHEADR
jgi:uncharacterized protein